MTCTDLQKPSSTFKEEKDIRKERKCRRKKTFSYLQSNSCYYGRSYYYLWFKGRTSSKYFKIFSKPICSTECKKKFHIVFSISHQCCDRWVCSSSGQKLFRGKFITEKVSSSDWLSLFQVVVENRIVNPKCFVMVNYINIAGSNVDHPTATGNWFADGIEPGGHLDRIDLLEQICENVGDSVVSCILLNLLKATVS